MPVERFPEVELVGIFIVVPNQDGTDEVKSGQMSSCIVGKHLEICILITQELPHSGFDTSRVIFGLAPNAKCTVHGD
jgi:hypothetical protein